MIIGISITTDQANIETMFVSGKSLPNSDKIDINCHINYADLTIDEKLIYDNAIALVVDKNYNLIINTTAELEINRVTSTILEQGTDEVDFETLSELDKDTLRKLLGLFIKLSS